MPSSITEYPKWCLIATWLFWNEVISTIVWFLEDIMWDRIFLGLLPIIAFFPPANFMTSFFITKIKLDSGVAIGKKRLFGGLLFSSNGKGGVTKYQSIQYATARRFQPPQPLPPSNSRVLNVPVESMPQNISPLNCDRLPFIRSALENLHAHVTKGYLGSEEVGHQLNIWAPSEKKLDKDENIQLRPVLVVFHGGTYTYSSPHQSLIDGTSWAKNKGYVVVNVAYRLGIAGYFYHENMDKNAMTANCGLLDAICALRWIRDNIHHFGGDKNSVTVAGQSAGAMLITKLAAVKQVVDEKLFQKMIVMSGGSQLCLSKKLAARVYFETALVSGFIPKSKQQAGNIMILSDEDQKSFDHSEFAKYLQNLPLKKLMDVQHEVSKKCTGQYMRSERAHLPAYGPSIDNALIFKNPVRQLQQDQKHHAIPCLIGTTASEATIFTSLTQPQETKQEAIEKFKKRLRSWITETTSCAVQDEKLIDRVINAYLEDGKFKNRLGMTADPPFVALNGDWVFRIPAENFANAMTKNASALNSKNAPCFMYCLQEPSLFSKLGTPHCADLPYFYDCLRNWQFLSGLWTPARVALKNKMMNDADNFMRGKFDKLWTPWSEEERPVFFYDTNVVSGDDFWLPKTDNKDNHFSGLVFKPDDIEAQAAKPLQELFFDFF